MAFNDETLQERNDLGLGLASAPGTVMLDGNTFGGSADSGGFDQGGMPTLSNQPAPFDAGTGGAGLGLSGGGRTQSDQEYLQSLPPMQKIGLALQSFSAGVAGRASPIDELLKQKRARDQEHRADLANTIGVIQKGTEILRKMPPGLARDAVARELGKAVGGGDIAKVFAATGDQHQEIKSVLATFSDPDVQASLLKACSDDPDFRGCVLRQSRDKDAMARYDAQADSKRMPGIVKKLAAAVDQAGKTGVLDEYKGADGKYSVPFAKLIELNDQAKIFSPEEMDTLRRNEGMLSPFGIKTTKEIEAQAVERAKQSERPTKEDFKIGQTRRVFDSAGAELQQEFTKDGWRTIGKREKPDRTGDKPLTPYQKREQAAKDAAVKLLKDRGIEPGDDDALGKLVNPTDAKGRDNPKFVGAAQAGRLKKAFDLANKPTIAETTGRDEEARGKTKAKTATTFDADGSGYDDARAQAAGMKPQAATGPNKGHMGSVAPVTADERARLGLPEGSYVMLKGRDHPTWDKAVAAEEARGSKIVKAGDRYYSVPATKAAPTSAAKPSAGPNLAPADRQAAIDAATKAVNAGADPAAVKKRLKDKYGIDVTFTTQKK